MVESPFLGLFLFLGTPLVSSFSQHEIPREIPLSLGSIVLVLI